MQGHDYFYNITRPSQTNNHTVRNNEFDNIIRSDRYKDSEKTYPAHLFIFHK